MLRAGGRRLLAPGLRRLGLGTGAAGQAGPAAAAAGVRAYHERVVDHYNNPRNVGSFDKEDPNVGTGLVGAPAFSGSFWSTYQFQDGFLRGWNVGAGITYVGRRTGDLNNSYSVGGYARLDAAVFYDFNEHARFSINARNLTDRRYIEQPFNQFNNAPGAPFSVLATLTARM